MKARIVSALVIVLVLFACCDNSHGRRGGGGRGGGGRGGSGRGRGSSSRGSSSSSSSNPAHRGTTYDRRPSGKSENPPPVAQAPPPRNLPPIAKPAPKPSAPELPVQPSAPKLPPIGSNQQPAYNPNYRPQNPPAYPGPQTNLGAPPAYPGPNNPPAYPGGVNQRPPAYDFNQPRPGSAPYPQQPGSVNAPYPRQPGSAPYPQQPGSANAPYPRQPGSAPYPQQPGSANAPYPRQPGSAPYPQQPGSANAAYPRQPGNFPYPRQPGFNYAAAPAYAQHSSFPIGGSSSSKPYKKQGFLGQLLGSGKHGGGGYYKQPKHYGGSMGGGLLGGGLGGGRSAISPAMYPILPLVMRHKMHKPKLFPSFGRPSFFFFPMPYYHHHHHGYWGSSYGPEYGIGHDSYRGRCAKPLTPDNGYIECNSSTRGAKCRATCKEGYRFADNATNKENECWHVGGVWRPSRNFPVCEPICNNECQNGGKCAQANLCSCPPSYRGDVCQHHFLNCDVRKLAGNRSSTIGWSCRHLKNETMCAVRCRGENNHFLEDPKDSRTYHCTIDGRWTPETVPPCIDDQITEVVSVSTSSTTFSPPSETNSVDAKIE